MNAKVPAASLDRCVGRRWISTCLSCERKPKVSALLDALSEARCFREYDVVGNLTPWWMLADVLRWSERSLSRGFQSGTISPFAKLTTTVSSWGHILSRRLRKAFEGIASMIIPRHRARLKDRWFQDHCF